MRAPNRLSEEIKDSLRSHSKCFHSNSREEKRDGPPLAPVLPAKECLGLSSEAGIIAGRSPRVMAELTHPGVGRGVLHNDKAARPRAPAEKLDGGY